MLTKTDAAHPGWDHEKNTNLVGAIMKYHDLRTTLGRGVFRLTVMLLAVVLAVGSSHWPAYISLRETHVGYGLARLICTALCGSPPICGSSSVGSGSAMGALQARTGYDSF